VPRAEGKVLGTGHEALGIGLQPKRPFLLSVTPLDVGHDCRLPAAGCRPPFPICVWSLTAHFGYSGSVNPLKDYDPSKLPTPRGPVPSSGVVTLRVRYNECDPMGVAHHGAYVSWLEMGRVELLRGAGVSYAELEQAGVFLVVVKLELSYKRPARYDDQIEVRTVVQRATRVKIEHSYEVWRASAELGSELCVVASSTIACVDGQGRVSALPSWLSGSP
jgi:acyl-CoA thioester hydrolase